MGVFNNSIKKASAVQRALEAVREGEQALYIDTSRIRCAPQTRKENNPGFSVESLTELAESMKDNGQGEPAVLRPDPEGIAEFLMVAGERRYRSCKMVGIPLLAFIRELTDKQARAVQLAENIQREDLTPLEIAEELQRDYDDLGTLGLVAKQWGKSINWIHERIKFLKAVNSDGIAHHAVAAGLTSDVSTVNDLAKLEKQNPLAAQKLVDEALANPSINLRNSARQELKRAKAPEPPANATFAVEPAEAEPPRASVSRLSQQAHNETAVPGAPEPRRGEGGGSRTSRAARTSEGSAAPARDDVDQRDAEQKTRGPALTFEQYVDALDSGAPGMIRYREAGWHAFCNGGELGEKFDNLEGLLSRLAAAGIPRIEVEYGNLTHR